MRARLLVDEEIAGYTASLEHEVRQAYEAGIPKRRIRMEGLGTSDSKTLEDMLNHTAAAHAALIERFQDDPHAGRYIYDEYSVVLTVTLTGRALDDALTEQEWTLSADEASARHFNVAEFSVDTRDDGSTFLVAITDGFVPTLGLLHPVVAWVRFPENENEALMWLGSRKR